jgi:ABC-type multidrug transport system fused ATPase/permease subunit
LARAIARNPSILILDEISSNIDLRTERLLREGLRATCVGRTLILIAHRLGFISSFDRIVVLEHGRVSECGTHTQLMQNKDIYHQAWTAYDEISTASSLKSRRASNDLGLRPEDPVPSRAGIESGVN